MTTHIGQVEGESAPGVFPASRRVVVLLLLIIPLSQIGLDIYTPALPQMAADFAAANDLV
jgi:MFS transporter, DHA1 family, multidrug resistance protein